MLVGGDSAETTPLYSPDGKSIAFISVHEDGPQIRLMPSDGGRLRQLTTLKMGVQPPMVFSPPTPMGGSRTPTAAAAK